LSITNVIGEQASLEWRSATQLLYSAKFAAGLHCLLLSDSYGGSLQWYVNIRFRAKVPSGPD